MTEFLLWNLPTQSLEDVPYDAAFSKTQIES